MNLEIERLVPDASPDSTLYVADEDLRVVYTNEEWRRFARQNEGMELAGPALDTNLLDNMSGRERERWASIYKLLLDGELSHYEEDFICSSPAERRIYRLRSTPVKQDDGSTLLVHHTVRVDDKPEEREEMRRRVRALEADPKMVEREYRTRVLERDIGVPGFRVARFMKPLEGVGGDVLWHREYDNGTTDLLIADVMGHGVEACIHAVKMVTMLDALAADYRKKQDIIASLNRGMLRHRPEHESAFASGLLLRFEQRNPVVRCVNFGHPAPIFSRSGEVELDVGLPIGIVDTMPVWPEEELDLSDHGARFLLFSDGITEQFDSSGAMYGTDRLVRSFRAALDLDLDASIDRVLADVDAFRGDALVKDDRTVIAVEQIEAD